MRLVPVLVAVALVGSGCSGGQEPRAGCLRRPTSYDSGVVVRDLRCGRGRVAQAGDSVRILYTARLPSGEVFASVTEPFVAALGRDQLLPGLDQGIAGMGVGGRRRVRIPPELAYGRAGFPPHVGPGEEVVFVVELVSARPRRP